MDREVIGQDKLCSVFSVEQCERGRKSFLYVPGSGCADTKNKQRRSVRANKRCLAFIEIAFVACVVFDLSFACVVFVLVRWCGHVREGVGVGRLHAA